MHSAQLHPKGQSRHPQRVLKDRSAFPAYSTRVDLHNLVKGLRFPLPKGATDERLSQKEHTFFLLRISSVGCN
jgi:hypothetical protein